MVLKLIRQAGTLSILLLLLAHPADLSSCGPFFPEAVFTRSTRPDNERAFFSGDLGILQPSYERRYLAMAYRLLSGVPLSNAQIAAVTDLERFRRPEVDKALAEWLAARKQVTGTKDLTLDVYRRGSYFIMYPSCGADAFLTASRTLQKLIQEAGPSSGEVNDWLAAQDEVFANCGESSGILSATAVVTSASIPDEAQPGSTERIRANRAYQIAAAEFYSGMFGEARTTFRQIANDAASPWHVLAPYLIARTYLRQDNYAAARDQLKTVLADPREAGIQRQARSLLDYALGHLDSALQLLDLTKRLMKPDAEDLGHDLSDYTFLYDTKQSDSLPSYASVLNLEAVVAQDDLTAWIYTFQNPRSLRAPNSEDRWRHTHSLPWLIATLYSAGGKSASAGELVEAALAVPRNSPAYLTARYEAARYLTEAGKKDQAAQILDALLKQRSVSDGSTVNAFRAERMQVARTFDEFLAYAPRTPVSVTYEYESAPLGTPEKQYSKPLSTFDTDATSVFNKSLPLDLWLRAIRNRNLATSLRTELAQSGWVRAVIANQRATEFARELTALKPSYSTGLQLFINASDRAQQIFEAVYFILHHSELQPWVRAGIQRQTRDGRVDDFRDNWWCAVHSSGQLYRGFDYYQMQSARSQAAVEFLSPEEKQEFETQEEALKNAGSGPEFLSSIAVSWAKSHPDDPRNPETLALAVKTSRFGCPDPNSALGVEAAFHWLHSRYPTSTWTQKTPYWFK